MLTGRGVLARTICVGGSTPVFAGNWPGRVVGTSSGVSGRVVGKPVLADRVRVGGMVMLVGTSVAWICCSCGALVRLQALTKNTSNKLRPIIFALRVMQLPS